MSIPRFYIVMFHFLTSLHWLFLLVLMQVLPKTQNEQPVPRPDDITTHAMTEPHSVHAFTHFLIWLLIPAFLFIHPLPVEGASVFKTWTDLRSFCLDCKGVFLFSFFLSPQAELGHSRSDNHERRYSRRSRSRQVNSSLNKKKKTLWLKYVLSILN